MDFLEFAGWESRDHAQIWSAGFARHGMSIAVYINGKHDLPRMHRVGDNVQKATRFNRFQNHFPCQSTILQALLIRVAWQDAHLKKLALFQNLAIRLCLLQPNIELESPAFARGWVEEVEFEVAEFGDSGFEADGNFLARLMSCGRRDFNLQAG